jgi:hypothetical protein
MADTQKDDVNNSPGFQGTGKDIGNPDNKGEGRIGERSDSEDSFTAGNNTPEIATNDGSVIETLDTAFHGTPGWSEGENISGSNRADYYEARSNGKSDVEEELDELRERNKSADSKNE